MSDETIEQMENAWAIQMAAVYADGPRKGQRLYEADPLYMRGVMDLRVRIEEAKAAQASTPKINEGQLVWLNQAQGATDATGGRLYQPGSKFSENLQAARVKVLEGGDISGLKLGGPEGVKLGAAMPAPSLTPAIPQAINTNRGPKS